MVSQGEDPTYSEVRTVFGRSYALDCTMVMTDKSTRRPCISMTQQCKCNVRIITTSELSKDHHCIAQVFHRE